MYAKKELAYAANRIKRVAQGHRVSEADEQPEMYEAMNGGDSSDVEVQARWRTFHLPEKNQ